MITAEELEECDIFPKKITFASAAKCIVYTAFMVFACLLMLSFYSGRDVSSIVSFDSIKFGSESVFMKKLMNLDLKYDYENSHNFTVSVEDLSDVFFISKYVTESVPLIAKGVSNNWNAIHKWSDKEYLINKHRNVNITVESLTDPVIAYYKEGFKQEEMSYKDFIEHSTKTGRASNYFYHDQSLSSELLPDVKKPEFTEILKHEATLISQSYNGITVPARSEAKEQLLCQIEGTTYIRIVPAMHRYGVYPFTKKYGPTNFAGVNFFAEELGRFPNYSATRRMIVILEKGDCFFLPSFWWYSIQTEEEKNNILVTFAYKSHSRWVEMIMQGIKEEEF